MLHLLDKNSDYKDIKKSIESSLLSSNDIFKFWLYKRDVRYGEKEKLLSFKLFFVLYDLYPNTCLTIVKENILSDAGYWKDLYLMWGLINDMDMDTNEKYNKYNELICVFRETLMTQRLKDLRILNNAVKPNNINDFTNDELRLFIKNNNITLDMSYVGKYFVREKSIYNKKLYWYIEIDNKLVKQMHVSFMLRDTLKIKMTNGSLELYPLKKNVPSKAKKNYRELNAKLNIALEVPEVLMCSKDYNLINISKCPNIFLKKNKKLLIKNNISINDTFKENTINKIHFKKLNKILKSSNETL